MGATKELKEQRAIPKPRKRPGNQVNQPPIITYRPTTEERDQLAGGALELTEAVEIIARAIENDARLVMGYKPENGSFYLILRDAGTPYEESVAVSYWHSDPVKATLGMAFGLAKRFPHFPDLPPTQLDLGEDW